MDLRKYKLGRFFLDTPMGAKLGEQEPLLSREDRQLFLAMAEAIYPVVGVDVSAWQGDIDWPKLSTKVYYAYIRAGRGNDYRDSYYDKNVLGAKQTGRAYGTYWYMIPRTATNFKNQVDLFSEIYKDSGSQLPPVMDFEESSLDKSGTMGWFVKAVTRFVENTGVYPMVYTSAGWWNGHVARNDIAKQCLLWVAAWTTAENPLIPSDWGSINQPRTWTFWQHTSKLVGKDYGVSSINLDGDRYHYSLAQFNKQFKTNLSPLGGEVPPPPGEIIPLYKVQLKSVLNPRGSASVSGTDFGAVGKDSIIPIVEEKDGFGRSEFWISVKDEYVTKL